MISNLENFYLTQDEPNRSCLLTLRKIILDENEQIAETWKWNMPCFTYGKKMFCFLWTDKKTNEPYILMVEGKHLQHPELEQGNRTRMKILRINPARDIPVHTVRKILQDALNLYSNSKTNSL